MRRRPAFWSPTETLLLQGGDARTALDDAGRNQYGCAAIPDGTLAAFGSSTASSISEPAFAAADRLRRQWLADSLIPSNRRSSGRSEGALDHRGVQATERRSATVLRLAQESRLLQQREGRRISAELAELCGVADIAGLDVALAASGTDLHRLVADMVSGGNPAAPPFIVMMEGCETGSGVVAALTRRPLRSATAGAASVSRTGARTLVPDIDAEPLQLRVRERDGTLRPHGELEAELEAVVSRAVAIGRRVLVVGLDLSKTGLLVPAPSFLAALQRRWPDQLDVLIDACQFRLSNRTLRRYLLEGFLVAVTGSKFFTGPSFCAALFVPPHADPRDHRSRLDAAAGSGSASFGLLLRWEAALAEMRRWSQLPDLKIRGFVASFATTIQDRLARDPVFEGLPAPCPDRGEFGHPAGWDGVATIFPFLLYRRPDSNDSRDAFTAQETDALFRSLPSANDAATGATAFQLGQPVRCGERDGVPVSALRLCLSARLVVEAIGTETDRSDAVTLRALATLDQLAARADAFHSTASRPAQHVQATS